VKVGTQAAGDEATLVKLETVPQTTLPSESVTAGATKTFAVWYTQNPVGEAITIPPVFVGVESIKTSVIWGIAKAGFVYRETGLSVTSELVVTTLVEVELTIAVYVSVAHADQ